MIGGNFPIDLKTFFRRKSIKIDDNSTFWLQSGRSAFTLLISLLKIKPVHEVLIPAYHCEEIAKPFLSRGLKVKFYQTPENLQIDLKDIKKTISPKTKLIIFINYLWFPQRKIKKLQTICRKKGIALLEDSVPMTLCRIKTKKNIFQLYSFRKTTGIPSGSLLLLPTGLSKNSLPRVQLSTNKKTVEYLKTAALIFRGLYQIIPWEKLRLISYKFHHLGEDLLDDTPRPISRISKFLTAHSDWKNIAKKRRANSEYLLKQLKTIKEVTPLFKTVPPNSTPLFFLITVAHTQKLKKFLLSNGIYTKVDWQWPQYLNKKNYPASVHLVDQSIYLTIDQRYGKSEIDFQVNKIKEFYQK